MQHNKKHPSTIVSLRTPSGTHIESVYSREAKSVQLCLFKDGNWKITKCVEDGTGQIYVPTSSPLPDLGVILLPERPEEYSSIDLLVGEIRCFIHRYVDLLPPFEILVSYYVLLTWVHEAFAEIGYLRFVGDLGSGKTRALNIVGAICCRPLFASGAATVSPIFWFLDEWKGTLVFDETDFRASDMTSEMTKLFNNGTTRGFPVLRQTINGKGVMSPRAFQVFGPKLVSMRGVFDDAALESRFFTADMGCGPVRADIPINLPDSYQVEAASIRNKLLMYRFRNLADMKANPGFVSSAFSGRVNQILVPLLSVIPSKDDRETVSDAVTEMQKAQKARRAASVEGEVLEVIVEMISQEPGDSIKLGDIVSSFVLKYGKDFERPITNRYVGEIIRSRLHIYSYKKRGVYVIPASQFGKITTLASRYGIEANRAGDETDMKE